MKTDFFLGFAAGCVLKNQLFKIITGLFIKAISYNKLVNNKKQFKKVILIAKIKNQALFDEYFPDLGTKYKTQPQWEYLPLKNIIKIELEQEIHEGPLDDYLNQTSLDIDFFKSFCELYIYVYYNFGENGYINVYKPSDTVCKTDFTIMETGLSQKYHDIICATFQCEGQQIYVTKYLKMFLNNKNNITPEILIMYNDSIKTNKASLRIVKNGEIINDLI